MMLPLFLSACGGAQQSPPPRLLGHSATPKQESTPAPQLGQAPRQSQQDAQALPAMRSAPGLQALRSQDGGYSIDTQEREAVRLFYRTVYASSDHVASGWNGDTGACAAGNVSAEYQAATLRRINWFRAMAGAPANVQWDAAYSAQAQQAALLMSANGALSHSPPANWKCHNSSGAQAAGKSNLSLGNAGPAAISAYISDNGGNNTAVGHRRWILLPQTRFMGTGDVSGAGVTAANALWVMDGNAFSSRPAVRDDFVAWPAKGYAPYQTVYPRWSFSYPKADFSKASVSMTENGKSIAVRQEALANGYGENTLVWLPGAYSDGMRWAKPAADTVYQVTLSNVLVGGQARSFSYSVTVFDPEQEGAAGALRISGSGSVNAGVSTAYSLNQIPGATGYEWRALRGSDYHLRDGAEQGSANFTLNVGNYSVVSSEFAANGAKSFHLAHPSGSGDQSMQFLPTLIGSAQAQLSFASRLGWATASQIARVEISLDEGKNWVSIWQQAGSSAENSFSRKTLSLAAYAEKAFLLRLRYEKGGSFYPQTNGNVGWYIDDLELQGVQQISVLSGPHSLSGTNFSTSFANNGMVWLQARPGMYGYFGAWSDLKAVSVSNQSVFNGTDGDDVMYGNGGWRLDGGAGFDLALYQGARSAYQVQKNADGLSVSGARGQDVLRNIERLQFDDKIIAFDLSGRAGQAYRLYQAAFNRTPDAGGLQYWIGVMDRGASQEAVAGGFIQSDEFRALYGGTPSDDEFVMRLYQNVLHRAPDAGGFEFWRDLLRQGRANRPQVLAAFAESPENQAGVAAAIANGIEYPR
ncbi:DUF4214 domain-containing protein [Massilia sp. W12]|uniref:DUF4214 domain-containing protein n=1 Tax=Massilia sp. W12 TaxID=3126507 RepID=UPI0030CC645F